MVLVVVALLLPASARSQSATIGVYFADGTPACPMPLGQMVTVYVKLFKTAGPVKTAHFKLVPSCTGAAIFGPVDYDVTFSNCITDGATIASFPVITPASCSNSWGFYFDVVPATGETSIQLTDCDGYPMVGIDAIRPIDGPPCDDLGSAIAPYRPTPADGATNVPTNTLLSYVGSANAIEFASHPLTYSSDDIICGYPYCLPGQSPCAYPVDPGLLQPHTTYFWRAYSFYPTHDWCDNVTSQAFTFTTGDGPLAAQPATWGSVKAMYRD